MITAPDTPLPTVVTATYRFGRFKLNPATRQVLVDNEPAPIGARAFDVLLALIERRDRLVTKNELLDLVWPGFVVEENNLQVQISALRKLLGADAIATVAGRGYRFTFETTDATGPPSSQTLNSVDAHTPSIAVLPFANLSDDASSEYFADGLAEELLNVLSQIRDIRVVSRTSSFYFKGKDVDLATVAQRLNVATLLEGSVRKSGTRVRIAAQLIHVATDSHIWSNTYDRELEDIFAVQDEIAQAIVIGLRPGILGSTSGAIPRDHVVAEVADASKGRTKSGEALRLLLEGRFYARSQTHEDRLKALEYYDRALALDPNFSSAWSAVASAYAAQAGYGGGISVGDGFRRARAAAQRALDLEPTLAAAHSTLSWIELYCDWNWKGAYASARHALELAPNDTGVLITASIVAGNIGRLEEEIAYIFRALELDPLDAKIHRQIAGLELDRMCLDAAEAALIRALEFNPRLALTNFIFGMLRLVEGRPADALVMFRQEPLEDYRLLGITLAHHAQGLEADSAAALRDLIEKYAAVSPCQIAEAYACRGEPELAFEWLDRAYASRDPRLVETKRDSLLRNLHDHSLWLPFLEKMGLADLGTDHARRG